MSVEAATVRVNGTSLYYEIMGEGHPFVLIHGGLVGRRMWEDQCESFAKHYKVIRYDVRGYGKSGIPEKPFWHYQDLYSLLKFLRINKAFVMGQSMGGGIAIDFTLEYPEMVSALILAAPALYGYEYSDEFLARGSALFSEAQKKGVSTVIRMIMDDLHWSPSKERRSARQKMKEMIKENFHVFCLDPYLAQSLNPPQIQRLSEINVPTLVIGAERDYPDNLAVLDVLEADIAGAVKVVIPGTGHFLNMDNPEEFNRMVLDFLSKI
jgi:3-oxoadipate enol-lactonase